MLRILKPQDAPYMLEWMHDDNVNRWFAVNFSEKTLADCERFINNSSSNDLHLAVVNDADEYMGTVSLKDIDYTKKIAEFAIAMRSCAMGKGFAQSAIHEVMRVGFMKLGLKKIYWNVRCDNIRAIRFYDKNAYTKVSFYEIQKLIGGGTACADKNLLWYCVEK